MVYDTPIKISKKNKNEFSISVALSDSTLITKTVSRNRLEQLYVEIEDLLKEN